MEFIISYFEPYRKYAVEEIRQVDKGVKETALAAGVSHIETDMDKAPFTEKLKALSPIFLRHIFPADRIFSLADVAPEDAPKVILAQLKDLCVLPEGRSFSVQCRRFAADPGFNAKDVEVCVGSYFDTLGAVPAFSDCDIINMDIDIISICIDGNRCYAGFSKASDNLNSHADEYRVLSRREGHISRAENKLREAICKFNIQITGKGYALDLGAAPGGWSRVLADFGFQVIAVDPGALDPRLAAYPNITHYKTRIENLEFSESFCIIVDDMNVDPQITANIMCSLADRLEENGLAVVTLKLPVSDVKKSVGESVEILSRRYDVLAIKSLSHNRRELTSLLRKKN